MLPKIKIFYYIKTKNRSEIRSCIYYIIKEQRNQSASFNDPAKNVFVKKKQAQKLLMAIKVSIK